VNEPLALELVRRCLPGLAGAPLRFSRLAGGGNNRLYRVEGPEGPLVLKHYFRHPAQPRDRLGAEFAFLEYAWGLGLRCVPRPLGRDEAEGAGLYTFVEGRPLHPGEPGPAEVEEALAFVAALNAGGRPGAERLGPAAEACFSVADQLRLVDGRVARLMALEPGDELEAEAAALVRSILLPAWREARQRLLERLGSSPPAWAGPLPRESWLISPSDLGFHNALRQPDGQLAFLDFEYAGWDDPAKLVCDFFLQPARPAPAAAFQAVARGVAALGPDPRGTLARVEALWPVLALKWCCILLNHFTRIDLARRAFAVADAVEHRAGQLEKARRLLGRLATAEGGMGIHG
jgi:hypothetical protein